MDPDFRINTRFVVSEVIDDEAVIMDLRTGNYFSAGGTGGQIWRALETDRGYASILRWLTTTYAAEPQTLKRSLDAFMADLVAHELVETLETDGANGAADMDGGPWTGPALRPFDPPCLTMHTDMQDLLLLDPIHDVDAAGWPVRKT